MAIVAEIIKAIASGIGDGVKGMSDAKQIKAPDTHSISSFNGGGNAGGISAIPGIVEADQVKNPVPQQSKAPEISIDTSGSREGADAQAAGATALRNGSQQGQGLLDGVLSDENQKCNIEDSEYSAMRHYVGKMRGK